MPCSRLLWIWDVTFAGHHQFSKQTRSACDKWASPNPECRELLFTPRNATKGETNREQHIKELKHKTDFRDDISVHPVLQKTHARL